MNSGFSEDLARSGFAHRARTKADGSVVYRLADKSRSVLLPARVWQQMGEEFAEALAPTRRRTRLLSIALFPGILIFAMTVGQIIPFAGVMILASILCGPIAIYLMHSHDVQKVTRSIELRLKSYPQCPDMPRDPARLPRGVEIACLVVIGPHLVLAIIGEIGGPDTYRGTPLSGMGIGPLQMLAMGLIGLRLLWPKLGPRLSGSR